MEEKKSQQQEQADTKEENMFGENENGSFGHRREEVGAQRLTGADWLVLAGSRWFSVVMVGSAPIRDRKLVTVARFFKAKPRHTNPEED